ncbi:MAG: carboxypeptidase-like regulatory domain-containing protein, partial [Bacteroidales bacterium]|nr:carboxypeptidase-like regulatory domain-containing protein [Bacteroidales bacterium]
MKKIFSLILIVLGFSALAQNRVSGTVTDAASGETLIGVSVYVENTTIGTATDLDGRYEISVPEGKNIVFDYVGYKSVTQPVAGRSVIDVALEEDTTFL